MKISEIKKMAETFASDVYTRSNGDAEQMICDSIRKEFGEDYSDQALEFALAWLDSAEAVGGNTVTVIETAKAETVTIGFDKRTAAIAHLRAALGLMTDVSVEENYLPLADQDFEIDKRAADLSLIIEKMEGN